MERNAAFRRLFHILSPAFLAYYLIPETLVDGITRTGVSILFVGTALCIEVARIALGIRLFGMRPYEGQRVSAYAQGALGLAFGLFVIKDPNIVVPVFLGMAWIDPLAAFARKRKWSRGLVVAAYFGLFFAAEFALGGIPSWSARFLFAALATAAATLMEGPKIPQVDDDLLMQVVPMAVLALAYAVFPGAASP